MDLFATCLVLADDELKIALVDLDLCFLRDPIGASRDRPEKDHQLDR